MRILQNKNVVTVIGCFIALGIICVVIGIVTMVIGMLIDHECYQLEPNDFYQSSICERYWKYDED